MKTEDFDTISIFSTLSNEDLLIDFSRHSYNIEENTNHDESMKLFQECKAEVLKRMKNERIKETKDLYNHVYLKKSFQVSNSGLDFRLIGDLYISIIHLIPNGKNIKHEEIIYVTMSKSAYKAYQLNPDRLFTERHLGNMLILSVK